MENLVFIGRFPKICRLSVASLRHYDELGLLRPKLVLHDKVRWAQNRDAVIERWNEWILE